MAEAPEVLVVGAGPVGLTAALELARRGAAARVVDRAADRSRLGRAVAVNARSLELLRPSGVTTRLIEAGLPVYRINLRHYTRLLATIDFERMDCRCNYLLSLAQSETEAILEAVLAEHGVAVERGTELTGLAQDAGGVDTRLVHGGRATEARFDVVVGADGAHSTVRAALGLGFAGERRPDNWSLADVVLDWPFGHGEGNLFMHDDGAVLFVIALGRSRYRVASNTVDALALLPAPSVVGEVLWRADFTVSLRRVTRYQQGRCFLAGDAAHIHSPAGGRGMNLGIEDAAELAQRIMDGGLDGYSDARRTAGARVVRESDWQFRMAAFRNPLAIVARNALVRYGLGLEALQKPFRLRMAGLS